MQHARRHLQTVAELGCIVCKKFLGVETPANVHHILQRRRLENGSWVKVIRGRNKASDYEVLPLCHQHHQGPYGVGIHSGQKTWEELFGTEEELYREVCEELGIEPTE